MNASKHRSSKCSKDQSHWCGFEHVQCAGTTVKHVNQNVHLSRYPFCRIFKKYRQLCKGTISSGCSEGDLLRHQATSQIHVRSLSKKSTDDAGNVLRWQTNSSNQQIQFDVTWFSQTVENQWMQLEKHRVLALIQASQIWWGQNCYEKFECHSKEHVCLFRVSNKKGNWNNCYSWNFGKSPHPQTPGEGSFGVNLNISHHERNYQNSRSRGWFRR